MRTAVLNRLRGSIFYRHYIALKRFIRVRPPVGHVDFGHLRKLAPISQQFGYDRGAPVDRYYIEQFLRLHASCIRGRVLEIGDDAYTRKFGSDAVTCRDVLHISEQNPIATFTGDLAACNNLPGNTFDCIIITQTLQFIFDCAAAIRTLHRVLKPGGVVLLTVPGISKIPQDQWGSLCCWTFTDRSIRQLFRTHFAEDAIVTQTSGNVLSAVAFLHGLGQEELDAFELDYHDPLFQLIISVKAVKADASSDCPHR